MRFRFRTIYAKNKREFLRKAEIDEEIYLNEIAISVINNLSVNINDNQNINNNYNDDYDNLKYNSNYKLILINDKLNSKKIYRFRQKFKKNKNKLIFRKSSQNSILTSASSL